MKFYKWILVLLLILLPDIALNDGTDSYDNYVAGTGAGTSLTTGTTNVLVGRNGGYALTTGSGNTCLGYGAGNRLTTGIGNVLLGMLAGESLTTDSHKLYISDGFYPAYGIFGDFSTGYFGINNTSPTVALDVTGSMAVSGTFTPEYVIADSIVIKPSAASANVLQRWKNSTGTTVATMDTTGTLDLKISNPDTVQTTNFAATGYGIINGAGIFRGGTTTTGSASADTTKGTNAAFTGYGIVNGAIIGRSGAAIKGVVSADSVSIKPAASAANVLLRGRNSTGINVATIDTTGAMQIGMPYNGNISFIAVNNDSTNTSATANVKAFANWGGTSILAHGKGRTDVRYGHQIGNWGTVEMDATSTYTGANGLIIGTRCAKPMIFGINDSFAAVIDSTEKVGIGTELPTAKLTVRSIVGDNDSLLVLRSSLGKTVAFIDSLGKSVSVIAKSDTVQTTNFAATGYGIINGASIMRGGLSLTGSTAKTINFAGMTPDMSDADNALLAFGTWNDEVDIGTQTAHFVPYQVHMHSTTSAPYDIAAMRLRVDTDGNNAQNAVQVLQIRSSISDSVASAGAFGAGMSIDAPMEVMTGEMVVGGFSMAGAYKPTSATNPVTILQACNWNTYAGTSVTQIADFYQNGAGNTVNDILRLNVIAGTATDGLHVSNTSGTMTNGIKLSGTIGTDITLQNSETITNTKNGIIEIGGALGYTYNVQAIEADSTLTSAVMVSGSIITNGAAAAAIEITLPTAVSGLTYKFVTTDTDSLIVVAGASDTITDSAAATLADYAAVGQVGETVELVAISDAVWQVMSKTGTWAAR